MADVINPATSIDPFKLSDFLNTGPDAGSSTGSSSADTIGGQPVNQEAVAKELRELAELFALLMRTLESDKSGNSSDPAVDTTSVVGRNNDAASGIEDTSGVDANVDGGGADTARGADTEGHVPPIKNEVAQDLAARNTATFQTPAAQSDHSAASQNSTLAAGAPTSADQATTSAGSGPNTTIIKNTSTHDEKIGEFFNGGSTTTPGAEIDLKPGQTGALHYQNGQGGFDAEADSQGQFESTASRLEFYADQNGKNNDDVSYIDGDNAAISVNDGHGRSAGETKSMAGDASPDIVTKDTGGLPTLAGDYDNSTQSMRAGAQFMQNELNGTGKVYIHPDDDRNGPGQNPMTMAQDSQQTYYATFGSA